MVAADRSCGDRIVQRKVIQIDEFRARQKRATNLMACYCDAVRAADELMAREVAELRRRETQPSVLRLESLDAGFPVRGDGWDFVYSANLLAGLPAVAARQVVKAVMAQLKPGGRLLLSNVSADARVGECSGCKGSGKVGRIESDMIELGAVVSPSLAGGHFVYRDGGELNVYLEINRSLGGAEAPRWLKPVPRLWLVGGA